MGCESSKSAPPIAGELAEQEKEVIRKSWSQFSTGDIVDNGIPMFLKIMENAEARSKFYFVKDKDVNSADFRQDPQLRSHVGKVFETIEMVVKNLDNLSAISPLLEALGDTHAYYHTTKELFEPVGEELLHAFEVKLKSKFNKETRKAWAHVHSIIEHRMMKGMDPH